MTGDLELTAGEAAFLASACLEASRNEGSVPAQVLAQVALHFDPEKGPVSERTARKAIEEGVLTSLVASQVLFDPLGVAYLASTQMLEGVSLSTEAKTKIYKMIRLGKSRFELAPMISLDLGAVLELCRRIVLLYSDRRERYVAIDPEIMGGLPVIRGTRIPVYSILGRVEEGESLADIAKDLGRVPAEALEAAVAYARTHPRRGRPKQFR